jgi:Glycosyltransferase family 87
MTAAPGTQLAKLDRVAIWVWGGFAVWSCAMVAVALGSGVRHDYSSYLKQWDLVLQRADPWSTDNAYGPIHNLLAPLVQLHALAPKLVIGGALVVALGFTLSTMTRERGLDSRAWLVFLLAGPANFLITGIAFTYGINDALAAALILFAVLARFEGRFSTTGILLGAAGALKFFPLVLVPFFMFDRNRLRISLAVAAGLCFVAIMGLAYLYWGGSIFKPLWYASGRKPKLLSILQALDTHPWLVGGRAAVDVLLRTNSAFVLAALIAALVVCWRIGVDWLAASVIGLLAVLTAYKVGHQQFYLSWAVLVAALPLVNTRSADRAGAVSIPFLLFLAAFQVLYMPDNLGRDGPLAVVRYNVGLVACPLSICTMWLVARASESSRRCWLPRFTW